MFDSTDSHRGGIDARIAACGAAALAAATWVVATRRQQKQAAKLHRILVELLLNALSSGDPATERHSRRVANLADVLAEALRIGRTEHATLRVAALLHDMGKIEDELFPLVHSSRPLSRKERDQINHHPCESADILEPLEPFHHGLTRIVSSHHECWNGNGYPKGLEGEQIPLAARIISAADVFDALTQPRSYHGPRPIPEVLDEIRKGAGERFDPQVVGLLDEPTIRARWVEIAQAGRREEEAAARNVEL
jgi:putative nucleotidyltransferase with HDIG domain